MGATVSQLVAARIQTSATEEAFRFPRGGGWASLSWQEVGVRVRAIAAGLRALGLQAGDRVALLSGTRVEWILADLGVLCAGAATTTIYPSSTVQECAYIARDSGAVVAFVEDASQLQKLAQRRAELPALRHVVLFQSEGAALCDPAPAAASSPYRDQAAWDGRALSLDALEALGRAQDEASPGEFRARIDQIQPGDLATLIYTSGTTGQPKGVELTHANWVYEAETMAQQGILSARDVHYLWLPMAHAFGKVLEVVQLRIGFPTAIDGRIEKLVENLAVVRPTFVCAVPRIFEKVYNRVQGQARAAGGAKAALFSWALGVGRRVSAHQQRGEGLSLFLAAQHKLADRLVFSKLRARFGGRLRFFISGSAPLSREVAEFFHAAGMLILEGYGLTETSAGAVVNRPDSYRFGSVGKPFPGVEVKIADDGEILLRGPNVMRGYHNLRAATEEVLRPDGWFHTGDIGEVDAQGFLRITDRKKDLIKTSGGKYVAPQAIEGALKAACPYLSQVLVHGNNRHYCTALLAIDEEATRAWASAQGLAAGSYAELAALPQVKQLLQGYVDALNRELPSYETIKRFAVLPRDLTTDGGELTPSLKMKRKVIEQRYQDMLDGLYLGAR